MSVNVAKHTGDFTTDPWPGKSFALIAGKTSALAQLAETKVVTDDPALILRAAARLAEIVDGLQIEHPARLAAFENLMQAGFEQNWALPMGSEELRSVLRSMDNSKRLATVAAAVSNSTDPENRKILGSILPYGLSPLVTGLDPRQLEELREAFLLKELPAAVATRETGRELYENLLALLSFAGTIARNMSNPGALRTLEADRAARLAAEARLASNE